MDLELLPHDGRRTAHSRRGIPDPSPEAQEVTRQILADCSLPPPSLGHAGEVRKCSNLNRHETLPPKHEQDEAEQPSTGSGPTSPSYGTLRTVKFESFPDIKKFNSKQPANRCNPGYVGPLSPSPEVVLTHRRAPDIEPRPKSFRRPRRFRTPEYKKKEPCLGSVLSGGERELRELGLGLNAVGIIRQAFRKWRLVSNRIHKWEESDEDDDDDMSGVPPLSLERALTMPPSIQSRSTPSSARPYSSSGRSQRQIEELSDKYTWTSSTKKAMGDINWAKKLPAVDDEPPGTVIERFADPVSQRWQLHRYAEKPEAWQTVDCAWDRVQTRDPHLSTHHTNFTSLAQRSEQIPGYTGCIGQASGDVDVAEEDFQPLSTVRTEQPWPTDTARRGDIPGYTGCKYWSDGLPARRHNAQPWQTTTARVHRIIPNEEKRSPFAQTGVFSRIVTTVPPHNPFVDKRERPRLKAPIVRVGGKFENLQPMWDITRPNTVKFREQDAHVLKEDARAKLSAHRQSLTDSINAYQSPGAALLDGITVEK